LATIAHPLFPARLGYRNYPSLRQEFNGIGPALPFHTFTFHEHIAPVVNDSAAAAAATGFGVASASDQSDSAPIDPAAADTAGCPALLFGSWLRVETGHSFAPTPQPRSARRNSSSRAANTRHKAAGKISDISDGGGDGSDIDISHSSQLLRFSSSSLQLQSGQWRRGRFRATRTRRWMGALLVECQWDEPAAGIKVEGAAAAEPSAAGASDRPDDWTSDSSIGGATSAAVRVWMAPALPARRYRRQPAASRSEAASAPSSTAPRPALAGADPPPDLLFTFLPLRADDGSQSLAALVERSSGWHSNSVSTGQAATVRHGRAFIRI
jgi:hypothetical protein